MDDIRSWTGMKFFEVKRTQLEAESMRLLHFYHDMRSNFMVLYLRPSYSNHFTMQMIMAFLW